LSARPLGAGENLLSNGDFEQGTVLPWRAGSWGPDPELSKCRAAVDAEVFHGGKAAVRLTGRRARFVSERIPVKQKAHYKLSGWIKGEDVQKAELHLIRRNGKGRTVGAEVSAGFVRGTQDWTYVEAVFGSGDAELVSVWLWLPGETSGTAWFDDIALEKGARADSPNLLRNSGFTLCTNPGIPDFWGIPTRVPSMARDWVSGRYYGVDEAEESPAPGTKVLRVVHFGEFPPYLFSAGYLRLLPEATYALSVYMKSDQAEMPVWLGTYHGRRDKRVVVTDQWRRYSLTKVLKKKAKASFLPDAPGTLWIAAPQLEEGDEPTPYQPSAFDRAGTPAKPSRVVQAPLPAIACPRIGAPPFLDGRLDDPCWGEAQEAASFQLHRSGGKPACATRVLVARDAENLYVAFRCEEPDAANLETAAAGPKEVDVFRLNTVELFLSVDPKARKYFHFVTNPAGARYDAVGKAYEWDCDWRAAAAVGDKEWRVELAVPFHSLELPEAGGEWLVNFCRTRLTRGDAETSSWSHPDGFHAPVRFGRLRHVQARELARYVWRLDNMRLDKGEGESRALSVWLSSSGYRGREVQVRLEAPGLTPPRAWEQAALLIGGAARVAFAGLPDLASQADRVRLTLKNPYSERVLACVQRNLHALAAPDAARGSALNVLLEYSHYTDDAAARLRVELRLHGRVALHVNVLDPRSGGAAPLLRETTEATGPGSTTVSLPLAGLAPGEYRVVVGALSDGEEVGRASDVLVKLAPNPNEVRVDKHARSLVVDGKRFLARAFHGSRREEQWQFRELVEFGFNTVVAPLNYFPGLGYMTEINDAYEEACRRHLDQCGEHGLKVLLWLSGPYRVRSGRRARDGEGIHGNFSLLRERMVEVVRRLREHPAILGWYIADEPAKHSWEDRYGFAEGDLVQLHDAVKRADPYRPVMVNWNRGGAVNPGKEPYGTFACTDVSGIDFYCFSLHLYPEPLREFGEIARTFNDMSRPSGRPVYFWMQTYGSNDAAREPTPEELGCMVYLNLIHGTRLPAYYTEKSMHPPLWVRHKELNHEMQALADKVFFAPGAEEIDRGLHEESIHYALWRAGGRFWLIVANHDYRAVDLSMSLSALAPGGIESVRVVFGEGNAALRGGRLFDSLAPAARRVYVLEPGE